MGASSDPADAARAAGLVYVSAEDAGIRRIRHGRGFRYERPRGGAITARDRARIDALVIPPAWSDVWICPKPDGHIQVVGRDDAGRKQYLYHQRWRSARDAEKFANLAAFGRCLPKVRSQVAEDLTRRGLPQERVLALVVRLLDETLIRVGNAQYANGESYGLTTLGHEHLDVEGSTAVFEFTGKSAIEHHVEVHDAQLARLIRACDEADGPELFCYRRDGEIVDVTSDEVNEYLRSAAGPGVSARDFRTWGGTVAVVEELGSGGDDLLAAIDVAADRLGNTRAICRASYVHPVVEPAFDDGRLAAAWKQSRRSTRFSRAERATLRLLEG